MIRLHDTFKGNIIPLEEPRDRPLTIYLCGPTVYDVPHIGNARPAIVFDALVRTIRRMYQSPVIFASNFTDVDDKIILRAESRGISIEALCAETIVNYTESMRRLGIAEPDIRPRATESIDSMISMISRLIEQGVAYESGEHVLFDTTKVSPVFRKSGDAEYARIEQATYKKNMNDFVLWKPEWNGVGWDSPWGKGRPGWHIECSAMIKEHLGETIDIHGGGQDLIFPHHEAECQQSFGAHGKALARHWVHNGMVMANGKKMSKSDGNFITLDEVLDRPQGAESLRMSMLMTHYRQPYDFTKERLKEAQHLYNGLMDRAAGGYMPDQDFVHALEADFNTPLAIQKLANANPTSILPSMAMLGFGERPVEPMDYIDKAIFEERFKARKLQDWAKSDLLREQLNQRGIIVEDQPHGPTWKRVQQDVY